MHAFCPCCANFLNVQKDYEGRVRYRCMSCAYSYRLRHKCSQSIKTEKKHVEPVFRGDDAFKGGQKTETAVCPKCAHHEASFFEMQTRSADEPMTVFFQCAKCKSIWKE